MSQHPFSSVSIAKNEQKVPHPGVKWSVFAMKNENMECAQAPASEIGVRSQLIPRWNMVFVRDKAAVVARVSSAPFFTMANGKI